MSKKMMLLALAVVSAAFFALPAIASAQEIHLEPAEEFSVAGPGGELRIEETPTVTCTGTTGAGTYDAGSRTTGPFSLEYTGCHVNAIFTFGCYSEGAFANNTIISSDAFHLITIPFQAPGVLLTMRKSQISAGPSALSMSEAK